MRHGRASCGPSPSSPGAFLRWASPPARSGPITPWAGSASGSGTPLTTLRSCRASLSQLALEQLTGEKITVAAPFFTLPCGALLLTACFAAPFGFSLAWKRGDLLGVVQRLAFAIIIGAVTAVVAGAWLNGGPIFAPLAMGLAGVVIIRPLIEIGLRAWRPRLNAGAALRRTFWLPLSCFF